MKISDKNNRGSKRAVVQPLMKQSLFGSVEDFKWWNMVNGILTLTERWSIGYSRNNCYSCGKFGGPSIPERRYQPRSTRAKCFLTGIGYVPFKLKFSFFLYMQLTQEIAFVDIVHPRCKNLSKSRTDDLKQRKQMSQEAINWTITKPQH